MQRALAFLAPLCFLGLTVCAPAAAQNIAWVRGIATAEEDLLGGLVPIDDDSVVAIGTTRGPFAGFSNPGQAPVVWGREWNPLGQSQWDDVGGTGGAFLELVDGVPRRGLQKFAVMGTTDGGNGGGTGSLDIVFAEFDNPNEFDLNFVVTPFDDRATCIGSACVEDGFIMAGTSSVVGTNTLIDVWVWRRNVPGQFVNLGAAELLRIDAITPDGIRDRTASTSSALRTSLASLSSSGVTTRSGTGSGPYPSTRA